MVALRSLFGYLRKTNRIFQNPTSRLGPGTIAPQILLPLHDEHYQQAIAAATTSLHHVALCLAAVHAAGIGDIQHLRLDDVDLAGLHITITRVRRNLDALTRGALLNYLKERRVRWPNTANPHLIVSSRTAYDQRPVSDYTLTSCSRTSRPRSTSSARTACSRKPSPTAPIRSTSPRSSASPARPPCAAPTQPGRSSTPPPSRPLSDDRWTGRQTERRPDRAISHGS
jgi:hypothetical protein